MDDLRYPIGRPALEREATAATRRDAIGIVAGLPDALSRSVAGLSDAQLDRPYRPGGWTVRQLVHHVADSHMNAYIRLKLALTEVNPTIKPYDEGAWALLADSDGTPIDPSLSLLTALHTRWVTLLESLQDADFSRSLVHPERGPMTVDRLLEIYAWHSRHHTAHVTALRTREGW